jgi:hypothetical protein
LQHWLQSVQSPEGYLKLGRVVNQDCFADYFVACDYPLLLLQGYQVMLQ